MQLQLPPSHALPGLPPKNPACPGQVAGPKGNAWGWQRLCPLNTMPMPACPWAKGEAEMAGWGGTAGMSWPVMPTVTP